MAARATEERGTRATVIPFEQRRQEPEGARQVVAVVLDDGTVRSLRDGAWSGPQDREFSTGQIGGDGWILWWERRDFQA